MYLKLSRYFHRDFFFLDFELCYFQTSTNSNKYWDIFLELMHSRSNRFLSMKNIINFMDIPDKFKIQINLSIAYIVFLFTFLNAFPHIAITDYGVGGTALLNFSFSGFTLWKWSLYLLFLFLLAASVQITLLKEYKNWYNIVQVLFILSILSMVVMLIFPVSFLPN